MDCADSEEGIQLHHQYGVETESLVPQQTYVPWVTFNHVSIFCQNIFVNLFTSFILVLWNKRYNANFNWNLQEHSEDDTSEDCQFDLFNCLCRDYLQGVPECNRHKKKRNVCLNNWWFCWSFSDHSVIIRWLMISKMHKRCWSSCAKFPNRPARWEPSPCPRWWSGWWRGGQIQIN